MSKQETIPAFQEKWDSSNSELSTRPSVLDRLAPQKSLKINFNCLNLGVGGGNRVILELASRLRLRGHDVSINAIGKDGDTAWFGDLGGVKVHFAFPSKMTRLFNQKLLKRSFLDVQGDLLAETVSELECDVNIATFCLTANPTFESGKGNMFYLMQNYEPLFFNDSMFTEKAEKSYHLPLTKLCVSKWLQEKVGGFYVGNGVNTNTFHPRRLFDQKEPNSVLYQYRGIPWKGDTLAMKTLRHLHNANPNAKIHILARKNSPVETDFPFELHTDLPDKELAELYSLARVLLFTSDFEGYGLPPLEALACGTNVVSTKFTGNEYLVNEQNSLLAVNPPDLSSAILRLQNDDDLAQSQIEQAASTVKAHDFDRVVERVLQIFGSCGGR